MAGKPRFQPAPHGTGYDLPQIKRRARATYSWRIDFRSLVSRPAIAAILTSLAACASPPVQTDTRCPSLQSYSPASQAAVLSGLRAMVMLESINERDIDILPLNVREPIKTLYTAGPEVRLYINHYGALRAQCRALMK